MPKLVLISVVFAALYLASPPVFGQRAMFILRHAERAEYDERDGVLSKAGEVRAETLARLLCEAGISTIITTGAKRARQTAEPLARALGLTPRIIKTLSAETPEAQHAEDEIVLIIDRQKLKWEADYAKKLMDEIRSRHKNDIVLIIGHQNTVPEIVRATGYAGEVKIGDFEHDDIFVVVPKECGPPTVLHLNY
jgi:phosphohistidine phosphatase SixA